LHRGVKCLQRMKKLIFLLFLIVLLFYPGNAFAADVLLFDSTNNYLGACQLTDKSEWNLDKELNVSLFQVWYNWDSNETDLPVIVLYEGKEFASFTAKRTNCDTYQKQWCNADFQIGKTFPKGKYETKIPTKKQCLKPGGTGAIRLFGADSSTSQETLATNTPTITQVPTPKPTTVAVTPAVVTSQIPGCSACIKTVVATAVGTSLVSSFIFSFILRKK
jgi:hypothetical protein